MSYSQLHVPGCTSLSPGGIIRAVMLLTKDNHRIKSLRINGVYGIQKEDLETLHNLINHDQTQQKRGKILYHEYSKFSTLKVLETNRPLDVDVCPKCNEVRVVFDCPRVLCKQQQQVGECRGCDSCIMRCMQCGICINDIQETEEASCADILCLDCWLKLPKCNFCNKPYCGQHADQQHTLSGSIGFICATCHSKFN